MKKTLLIILLLLVSFLCHSQEKLYKEFGRTQTLTHFEYEMLKQVKIKKFENTGLSLTLEESILDSTKIGKDMVYTYKLERVFSNGIIRLRKVSAEKIYSLYGKQFPEFKLKNLDGKVVSLSDFKGKPILINFWFTGCGPCIKEMPALNNIQKKYSDQLVFLSISFNTKKELDHFFENHSFNFDHLVNAKTLIDEIGMSGYPKNIIINKEGFVHQILGSIHQQINAEGNIVEGNGQEITREIDKVLCVQ